MRLSNKCTYTHKHALWSNFSQILTPGKPWSGVRPNTLPQRAKSDDVAAKGSQSERSEEEAILHLVIQPVVTRANSRSHTHTHTHSDCFLEGLCEQLTGLAEGRTWGLESVSRDGHFTNPTDKHVSCFCNVYNTLSGLEQQGLCDGLCLHVHSMFNESSSCRLNHTDTQMSDWPTLCDPSRFWLKYQRRNVNNYI